MSRYRQNPMVRLTPAAVVAAVILAVLLLMSGGGSRKRVSSSSGKTSSSDSSSYTRCPVCGYTIETCVTSGYGKRADPFGSGETQQHDGLDLAAPEGTPVMSVEDGVVSAVRRSETGYGNMIVIDHGGGKSTLYAHCERLFAEEGDSVVRGQIIATVGETGNATGPHLHYELRIDGVPRRVY